MGDIVWASQYGAVGDNLANDTPAFATMAGLGNTVYFIEPRTYRLVPGGTSPFTYTNTLSNTYRSIPLQSSNQTFCGYGATYHQVSRPGVVLADVQPTFCSDKNTTIGALKDLSWLGGTFDPANDGDPNSNQRFAYLNGVSGVRMSDMTGRSSASRRGYFAHIDNCEDLFIRGYRGYNMTGGVNLRYCHRVNFTDFSFYNFSEAIDLDGPLDRIVLMNGHFESLARTNQAIDVNNTSDGIIGNFSVKSLGNIITVNKKTTQPDNFTDYLSNSFVKNVPNAERVFIKNITGEHIGTSAVPAFYYGWDWSSGSLAGIGVVEDQTLEGVKLKDTSYLYIREVKNMRISDVSLEDVICPTGIAAIHCLSSSATPDQIGWSDLAIELDRVRIERAERGAVYISTPRRAVVRGLITKGNNTSGSSDADLKITSLHTRAGNVIIDDCQIEGDVVLNGDSTSPTAWTALSLIKLNAIRTNGGNLYRATQEGLTAPSGGPSGTGLNIADDGSASISAWAGSTAYSVDNVRSNNGLNYICMTPGTSASSGGPSGSDQRIQDGTVVWRPFNGVVKWEYLPTPYAVRWGKNNSVRGTVTLQGDVQKHIQGSSMSGIMGNLAATGTVNKVVFVAKRRCLITRVSYVASADVAANSTNYRNLILRRARAGSVTNIATIDTSSTGFTAFVPRDGGVPASPAGAYLEVNDVVLINSNPSSSGVEITDLAVTVDFIEY